MFLPQLMKSDPDQRLDQRQVNRSLLILLAAVAVSVSFSIFLLDELGKRVDLKRQIDLAFDSLTKTQDTSETAKAYRVALSKIGDRASGLIAFGAALPTLEVSSIYCEYELAREQYFSTQINQSQSASEAKVCATLEASSAESSTITSILTSSSPFTFRSEALLSLLMVLCGIIGASGAVLIGGEEKFALRRGAGGIVVIGVGAGFFVYLILKGGRAFFLIDPGLSSDVYSNPYPMSFAAAVGGMFAKQFFERLETWIDSRFGPEDDGPPPPSPADSAEPTPRQLTAGATELDQPTELPPVNPADQQPSQA